MKYSFYLYIFVMASVTYLTRMVPFVLFKKKIKNKFVLSFLYYIPYAVLSAMTLPAIFGSTSSKVSSVVGFLTAVFFAYRGKSLIKVTVLSCVAVFAVEFLMSYGVNPL